MGLGNGLVGLFKQWGKGIGNAADNFWLGADAQAVRKAISDEVGQKFKPKIDLAHTAESRRAENIKDLDAKLKESKQKLADAKTDWQAKYDKALADAKSKKQTDIDTYNAQSKTYKDALDKANAGKQDIFYRLQDSEASYDPSRTIFTDVNTGKNYILDLVNGGYRSLDSLKKKKQKDFLKNQGNYDHRLIDVDSKTGSVKVINAFDDSNRNVYKGNSIFNNYYNNKISAHNVDIRNADNEISRASSDFTTWQKNNPNQPQAWDDKNDLQPFTKNFKSNNPKPNGYSFNGKNYSKESDLDQAYQKALKHAQNKRDYFRKKASDYTSEQEAEIAQRIQDAKDMNKAKAFLGGTLGAGALYAGAKAMYGGDDTDNTGNIDNINNTDNTDYGKPDPDFNVGNIPEGKAQLESDTAPNPVETDFDPDKADALAAAAYDKGVEDSNSIESSGDLGNNIAAKTGGHTIDDGLFELLKAMEDPYKADAIANYIYSRHGNDPDVQRLGWRGWLNKFYGDSLRSSMNIDPSGYNGMHVSGGL